MNALLIVLGILFVLSILWRVSGPTWKTIPEKETHIVYRRGRFHRILKAGTRHIFSGFETVERIIDIRKQPVDFAISDLYAYDVPLGYTINFWYTLDPVTVARNDKRKLRELVQLDNQERQEQIRLRIKALLIKYITEFQKQNEFSTWQPREPPTGTDKLYPFAPGQFAYQSIIAKVRKDLSAALSSFGAVLCIPQPVVLDTFHLSFASEKIYGQLARAPPCGN